MPPMRVFIPQLENVGPNPSDVVVFLLLDHENEGPAGGHPWVLVEERSATLSLMIIGARARPHISLRLLNVPG